MAEPDEDLANTVSDDERVALERSLVRPTDNSARDGDLDPAQVPPAQ